MRKMILGLLAALGLTLAAPAFAQPPAVPALPDTERRTSYSISGTTCACSVNFQLYNDNTDVDQWIEVWVAGTRYLSTDPSFGWSLSSVTGPLATIPRPITDAVLTFNSVQTGTVQIVGAQRPRRLSQFAENRGVAARDLNQALTGIIAAQRETWDRINGLTGRVIQGPPGETIALMPAASLRANKVFTFDATGLIPQFLSNGGGTVVGPATSSNNGLVLWNGTNGALLKDLGSLGTTTTVLHGNAGGSPSFGAVALGTDVSGLLPVANGGIGIGSGTSGGVPYFSGSTTITSSAALTANLPVIGGGAGVAPSVGTRSGNTTAFVTTTGAQTNGNCVSIDASGNHIAAGSPCAAGGSSDVQVFTATGTWNKSGSPNTVKVIICGSAGGGAGGHRSAAGAFGSGGGAGGGGYCAERYLKGSDVSTPQTVTIATGGTGGPGATVNGNAGTAGNPGGTSTFGSLVSAFGGGAGSSNTGGGEGGAGGGPTQAGTSGGAVGAPGVSEFVFGSTLAGNSKAWCDGGNATSTPSSGACPFGGGGGGASTVSGGTLAAPGAGATAHGPGGGAGGSHTSADVGNAGGNGGKSLGCLTAPAGGAAGTNNGGSTSAQFNYSPGCGGGGGGAGNGSGTAGGNGGNGTNAGGGGGGGAGDNGNAGNGGNGGDGFAIVITWHHEERCAANDNDIDLCKAA